MSNINLADFFQKRKEQEEQLQKDLQTKAKELSKLIPESLKEFANETMSQMDKWLLSIYRNTLAAHVIVIK